jgi:hypothetical protein
MRAVSCTKPSTCWMRRDWRVPPLTISPTPWPICSSDPSTITPHSQLLCPRAAASRASSNTRFWRASRPPACPPKRALCTCTVWSPGPIACSISRPLVVPGRAPPWQSQRPPAKPEACKRWNRSKRIEAVNRSKRFACEPPTGGTSYHRSIWSKRRSSASCVRMYSRIIASSLPTVET